MECYYKYKYSNITNIIFQIGRKLDESILIIFGVFILVWHITYFSQIINGANILKILILIIKNLVILNLI